MRVARVISVQPKELLKNLKHFIHRFQYAGSGRFCPVCNRNSRKFGKAGIIPREDAKCMHCGALERHRLIWLYLKMKTNLFSGAPLKMLHVAPEPAIENSLRKQLGDNYLTADLFDPRAMVKMDITNIEYPDESFDVIYCCHVLEHVPNDRMAMREFHRVLNEGGWAIMIVPIAGDHTFEDFSVTDPAERAKLFGQSDHVRIYGRDFLNRLREAGFDVSEVSSEDFLNKDEISRMGITKAAGEIFFCKKMVLH